MSLQAWLIIPLFFLTLLAITFTRTTLRHWLSINPRNQVAARLRPVPIPYTFPWLGHTLDFLTPSPGRFFFSLLSWAPRERGACELLLAGQRTYILFSPTAVQALFKVRRHVASRQNFHKTFLVNGTGMSNRDHEMMVSKATKAKFEEDLHLEFLLNKTAVSELTRAFVCFIKQEIDSAREPVEENEGREVGLYAWLRPIMMRASVTAFMGQHIVNIYPQITDDFLEYDKGILDLVFGVPRLFKPRAYAAQERMLQGFVDWIQLVDKETDNRKPDTQDPEEEWEPSWGSRYSRARQALWRERGMSQSGRASVRQPAPFENVVESACRTSATDLIYTQVELGFVFGLNSNAVPATAWMLMHILDPRHPHLLPQVLREVRAAAPVNTDGSKLEAALDVRQLVTSPLLQSIFHEVLRVYVDVLVAREINEDLELPLDSHDNAHGRLLLRKNSVLLAPSMPSHHDSTFFKDPPAHVFYAERFLVPARREDHPDGPINYVFSSSGAGSRLWPWGGGRTICPGRVFAKQEVLAAVAMVLLLFDVEAADPDDYEIPGFSKAYSGSGTIVPNADVKIRMRRRP